MAAAVGVRGRCELPPCSGPGWLLSLSALLSVAARGAFATTHWVVTEDGKIQQQVAARASLSARARPRPGGFPGPAPGCSAPRGPAPRLPSHGPGAAAGATPVLRAGVAPSPFVLWPSPEPPASSQPSTLEAACRVGSVARPWGRGGGGGARALGTFCCAWALETADSLSLPPFLSGPPRVTSPPRRSRKQVAMPWCARVPRR